MKVTYIFLIKCTILLSEFANITAAPSDDSDTLVLLQVIFRHGNRTPDIISLYPNDPHLNQSYDPYGYGQLTTKGKKTEYEIGHYLRQTYNEFIPQQYTPNVVSSLTTNFDRTKMSLQLALAGLFPPLETDVFENGLNWQPIPYQVQTDEGIIRIPELECPKFVIQYLEYMVSEQGQEVINNYKELLEQLSNHTGLLLALPEMVWNLYETLESEQDFGLELPEWTSEFYPDKLADAASVYVDFSIATPSLKRLAIGNFLQTILNNCWGQKYNLLPKERKIFIYSGHDYQVSVLLNVLQGSYRSVPGYGSMIIFELHNINGTYGLKFYHKSNPEAAADPFIIPGCEDFCEIDKFADLISETLPGSNDTCI